MVSGISLNSVHFLKTQHSDYPSINRSFWSALNQLDECIRQPSPNTVGEMHGDRLQIQWWSDPSATFFAAQVLDIELSSMWEVFHVPVAGDQAVAGRRIQLANTTAQQAFEAVWQEVFDCLTGEPLPNIRHPSFAEVIAAGTNPAGMSAVHDERALVEHLQADVAYWSQMARALDKSRRREVENHPFLQTGKPVAAASAEPAIPKKLLMRDIDRWAAENSERIVILPRAISSTKRSLYESPDSLFESLELLATHYTEVKHGRLDWSSLKEHMGVAGVEIRPVGVPSAGGSQVEAYYVRWRGQRRLLDQHLVKGSARDPRYCLRIYFTFDTELGVVVVGSMPEHLNISTT